METLIYLENQPSKFAQLLPPHPEVVLTLDYKLPPQYVFFILRGSLKPLYQLTEDEFAQKVHEFKYICDTHFDMRLSAVTEAIDSENEYFDEKAFILKKKEEIWKYISPELYTIFWYMSLQSLVVPTESYQTQIKTIQTQIDTLKAQRNDQSSSAKRNLSKEIERLKGQKQNLQQEYEFYAKNKEETQTNFLNKHLINSFQKISEENLMNASTVFIQYCLYPRIMFSAPDAMYAFNFLKNLQQMKVPLFNMLHTLG